MSLLTYLLTFLLRRLGAYIYICDLRGRFSLRKYYLLRSNFDESV